MNQYTNLCIHSISVIIANVHDIVNELIMIFHSKMQDQQNMV